MQSTITIIVIILVVGIIYWYSQKSTKQYRRKENLLVYDTEPPLQIDPLENAEESLPLKTHYKNISHIFRAPPTNIENVFRETSPDKYVPLTVNPRASDIYVANLESEFIPYDQLDTSLPYERWPFLYYPGMYNANYSYNWPFNYSYPYNFYGGTLAGGLRNGRLGSSLKSGFGGSKMGGGIRN